MKKKNKKKKFTDIDEYNKEYNNNLSKKRNNDTFSKYDKDKDDNCNNNTKKKNDFKSSLDKLIFLFPNFSPDFVQEFYEENDSNYSRTKELLTKLSEEDEDNKDNKDNNENKDNKEIKDNKDKDKEEKNNNEKNIINDDDNNNIINEEENNNNNKKNNELKNKDNIDITHYAQFEVVDNEEFEKSINENKEKQKEKEKEKEKKNEKAKEKGKENNNNYYDCLLNLKDKSINEYNSIFNEETTFNDKNNCNNNNPLKNEIVIDDYLFEQNINFLCESFPFFTREEIIAKICDSNFDIDKVVLDILNPNIEQNEDDYANLEITDKDEILNNFVSFEDRKQTDFDIELFKDHLVQKEIEEMIKNDNLKKKNKYYDDSDYVIKDNNKKEEEPEEYFLNKPIDEIKTPSIKEDLKKLIKKFPLEEEFIIKLVYYQYMNYQLTYQYFCNSDDVKVGGLRQLLLDKTFSSPKGEVKKYNNNKNKKTIKKYRNEEEERQFEIFKNIIDKKPTNWKLDEYKNVNLNDYMAVRKRLIIEARNAYNNQNYKNGQILMAKAKRYKQEIDSLYKNQKYQQFLHNNDSRYRNSNEIDLHGLNLKESKYIIDKKIKALKEKKIDNNLKSISLTIITGTGSHSAGHQSVLYPNLIQWLKNRDKLSVDGKLNKGFIYVTIY